MAAARKPATPAKRVRMAAPERRNSLLETASRAFSASGYHATTTSQIAKAAGVSEPVLYQHFANKRDLYLACVAEMWVRMRRAWEWAISQEDSPQLWTMAMAAAILEAQDGDLITDVWSQAVCEPNDDPVIRDFVRTHLVEMQGFVTDVYRRAQEASAIRADCDPDAEAWIFIAIGLLRSMDGRLGGLVTPKFPEIVSSRQRWLASA